MKNFMHLPIEDVKLSEIKGIHPIAEKNFSMNDEQFSSMGRSIGTIGITVPIILYRGKVVDGRHRFKIATMLEFDSVPCRIIPNNTKLNTIMEEQIMSLENRRHLSPTQLACKLVLEYIEMKANKEKVTQEILITRNPVSMKYFKDCHYIYKNDIDIFNIIKDAGSVKIMNNFTTRPDVIKEHIKSRKKEDAIKSECKKLSDKYLDDEYIINGKKLICDKALEDATRFGFTAKDLANYFYKLAKQEANDA